MPSEEHSLTGYKQGHTRFRPSTHVPLSTLCLARELGGSETASEHIPDGRHARRVPPSLLMQEELAWRVVRARGAYVRSFVRPVQQRFNI